MRIFRAAVKIHPIIGASVICLCALACSPSGDPLEKDIQTAAQAMNSARPLGDFEYQGAVGAIERKDYGAALDYLQAAKAKNPQDPRVLNAIGVVYDKLGRFDLSARYYAQALALDPGSPILANNLAYSKRLQSMIDGEPPVAVAAAEHPAAPKALASAEHEAAAPAEQPAVPPGTQVAAIEPDQAPAVLASQTGKAPEAEAAAQQPEAVKLAGTEADRTEAVAQERVQVASAEAATPGQDSGKTGTENTVQTTERPVSAALPASEPPASDPEARQMMAEIDPAAGDQTHDSAKSPPRVFKRVGTAVAQLFQPAAKLQAEETAASPWIDPESMAPRLAEMRDKLAAKMQEEPPRLEYHYGSKERPAKRNVLAAAASKGGVHSSMLLASLRPVPTVRDAFASIDPLQGFGASVAQAGTASVRQGSDLSWTSQQDRTGLQPYSGAYDPEGLSVSSDLARAIGLSGRQGPCRCRGSPLDGGAGLSAEKRGRAREAERTHSAGRVRLSWKIGVQYE